MRIEDNKEYLARKMDYYNVNQEDTLRRIADGYSDHFPEFEEVPRHPEPIPEWQQALIKDFIRANGYPDIQ